MPFISVLLIGVTLLACDFLRQQIKKRLEPSLAKSLIMDFILSLELCTVAFENGAILEHYGFVFWSLGLICMATYQVLRWKDLSMPTPYVHLLDHIAGSKTIKEVLLRTAVMVISGLVTYRYVKAIWKLEMTTIHIGRDKAVDSCVFPWTHVPIHHSILAEMAGSFVLGTIPPVILESPTYNKGHPAVPALMVAFVVWVTVSLAMGISGGLYNPMLASALLAGCSGHSIIEHILIYWIGSTLGALGAFYVYPTIKGILLTPDPNEHSKKAI